MSCRLALASGLAAWHALALGAEQASASAVQGDAVSLVQHGLRPGVPSSGPSDLSSNVGEPTLSRWESLVQHGMRPGASSSESSNLSSSVVEPTVYHWRQMSQAGFEDALLHVPNGDDIHIFTYPNSVDMVISKKIKEVGEWDDDVVPYICKEFQKYGVGNFLDVGANIGAITLPVMACMAGRGKVFAVEAIPANVQRLMASVYRNGMENVSVVSNVVGSHSDPNQTKMIMGGLSKGASSKLEHKDVGRDSVVMELPQTTLDLIATKEPGMRNLLAMKMDIEGSEGLALYGAQTLLAEAPPCFMRVELNPTLLDRAGTPKSEVISYLHEVGYNTSGMDAAEFKDYWIHQEDLTSCVARLS